MFVCCYYAFVFECSFVILCFIRVCVSQGLLGRRLRAELLRKLAVVPPHQLGTGIVLGLQVNPQAHGQNGAVLGCRFGPSNHNKKGDYAL